jgi:hypothetical protein
MRMLDSTILGEVLTDGSKNAVPTDTFTLKMLAKESKNIFNLKIMKEKVISDHLSFMIQDRNNYLFKRFDEKLSRLVESGIAKKIVDEYTTVRHDEEEQEPKQLTLDHLGLWFIFLLCGLAGSLVVLLTEIVTRKALARIQNS